jgi:hypothetical protein
MKKLYNIVKPLVAKSSEATKAKLVSQMYERLRAKMKEKFAKKDSQ